MGTASDSGGAGVDYVLVSSDNGSTWHTATGTTSWSYVWSPSSPSVFETILYYAVDMSGNAESPANGAQIAQDPYLPSSTLISPSGGGLYGTSGVSISGTSSDVGGSGLARVEVSLDGVNYTSLAGTASWSYDWMPSSSGSHTVRFRAVDDAGNFQGTPASISLSADISAPNALITSPSGGGLYGTSGVTITGTASDIGGSSVDRVEVSIDSGAYSSVTGTTNWSYSWTPASSGSHTFAFRAVDSLGNVQGTPASISLSADIDPPTATISSPSGGGNYGPSGVTITGAASDVGGSGLDRVEVSIDSGSYSSVTGTSSWSYSWTPATSGSHTIRFRAVDNLSNVQGTPTSISLSADLLAPSSTITQPASGTMYSTAGTTIRGTASDTGGSALERVEISTDGGSVWVDATGTTPWSYDWTPMTSGTFDIRVRALDNAGNQQAVADTLTLYADVNSPLPSVTAPAAGSYHAAAGTVIRGTASDTGGAGLNEVRILIDGSDAGAVTGTSIWSYNWSPSATSSYSFQIKAVDDVGNVGTTSPFTVYGDLTPPTGAITSHSSGSYISSSETVSGTASDAGSMVASVEVSIDAGPWTAASGTSSWSYALTVSSTGSHSIAIQVTDDVGNMTSPADTVNVLSDFTSPTVAINSPSPAGTLLLSSSVSTGGTAGDVGSVVQSVQVSLDGGSFSAASGTANWSLMLSSVTDGPHYITALASDSAGNTASTTRSFGVDVSQPDSSISSPSNGAFLTTTVVQVMGSATDPGWGGTGISSVEVGYAYGGTPVQWITASGTSSWSTTLNLPGTGTYTVSSRATDAASRTETSPDQITVNVNVDSTMPQVTSTSPYWDSISQAPPRGVPTGSNIEVEFSEPMNTASAQNAFALMDSNMSTVSGSFVWRDSSTMVFVPDAVLDEENFYTIQVQDTATDTVGNPLQSVWSQTIHTTDATPPNAAWSPSPAAMIDSTTSLFAVNFNEPMTTSDGEIRISTRDGEYSASIFGPSHPGTISTLIWTSAFRAEAQFYGSFREESIVDVEYNGMRDLAGNDAWDRNSYVVGGTDPDGIMPNEIALILPGPGATDVPNALYDFAQNRIIVILYAPLDPASVHANGSITLNIGGTIYQSGTDFDVTYPSEGGDGPEGGQMDIRIPTGEFPLADGVAVSMALSTGLSFADGSAFAGTTIVFTAGTLPSAQPVSLIDSLPRDGAVMVNDGWLNFSFGFDANIDPYTSDPGNFTIYETSTGIPVRAFNVDSGDYQGFMSRINEGAGTTPLRPNTGYTVEVGGSIADLYGNALTPATITFTTGDQSNSTVAPDLRPLWGQASAMVFANGNVWLEFGVDAGSPVGNDPLTVQARATGITTWAMSSPGGWWHQYSTSDTYAASITDFGSFGEPGLTWPGTGSESFTAVFTATDNMGYATSTSGDVFLDWTSIPAPGIPVANPVSAYGGTAYDVTFSWTGVDTVNADYLMVAAFLAAGNMDNPVFQTYLQPDATGFHFPFPVPPGDYLWVIAQAKAGLSGEDSLGIGYNGRNSDESRLNLGGAFPVQFGGDGSDEGWGIDVDGTGNVYVGGYFDQSGPNPVEYDGVVFAFDSGGSQIGSAVIPGQAGDDEGIEDVVIGPDGNLYACGIAAGNLAGGYTSADSNAFVARYNLSTLTWDWYDVLDGFFPNVINNATALAADSTGIYVAGDEEADLDGTAGPDLIDYSLDNIFVAKYDTSGSLLWLREFASRVDTSGGFASGTEYTLGVASDNAVSGTSWVYITGSTTGSLDGGPFPAYENAFAIQLNAATGSTGWIYQERDYPTSSGLGVAAAGTSAYLVGTYKPVPAADEQIIFARKFNASGSTVWLSTYSSGSGMINYVGGADVGPTGLVMGGLVIDPFDFYESDFFFLKLSLDGQTVEWTDQIDSGGVDQIHSIALDASENVYSTGRTSGNVDGNGNQGQEDAFIIKHDSDGIEQ
jgi:hypothetical protein